MKEHVANAHEADLEAQVSGAQLEETARKLKEARAAERRRQRFEQAQQRERDRASGRLPPLQPRPQPEPKPKPKEVAETPRRTGPR